ncbi:DUF3830 family protein [Sphingosinicella rhizophila]|uniref:DUF3830 family protein n=1 Tax=Sphingosinicella rhizophila TaxID=3050082 RepID=A0ABU3Q5L6_9SPHN|nr:DUF3830 family protein [Sphingosinicella sp. GR2756]MDT9598700.1 DUF3830 family protein [Sphingosinicella sp. GR2756]
MSNLKIIAGPFTFLGRLEAESAPRTCDYFKSCLPYSERIIHVRWSGEGCWIPLGDEAIDLPVENATSYPAPGQFIFYPGGFSETEILLAYGGVRFASKLGQLAGNHFLSITEGLDQLAQLGRLALWEGAQDIRFEMA